MYKTTHQNPRSTTNQHKRHQQTFHTTYQQQTIYRHYKTYIVLTQTIKSQTLIYTYIHINTTRNMNGVQQHIETKQPHTNTHKYTYTYICISHNSYAIKQRSTPKTTLKTHAYSINNNTQSNNNQTLQQFKQKQDIHKHTQRQSHTHTQQQQHIS